MHCGMKLTVTCNVDFFFFQNNVVDHPVDDDLDYSRKPLVLHMRMLLIVTISMILGMYSIFYDDSNSCIYHF